MESAILGAIAGAVVALLLVALFSQVRRRSRTRSDLESMLLAAQRESDDLRARLEELTAGTTLRRVLGQRSPVEDTPEFLITDVGLREADQADGSTSGAIAVPDRLVLSATVGEPLVKLAAFSHGLRRALSPASRNRIWFEMRREVRAARRRRRRDYRQYQRDVRAQDRSTLPVEDPA